VTRDDYIVYICAVRNIKAEQFHARYEAVECPNVPCDYDDCQGWIHQPLGWAAESKEIYADIDQRTKHKKLWLEFSNIQAAEDLTDDRETVNRFSVWLKTGNDDDAWS